MSSFTITFRAVEQREPLTVEADSYRPANGLIYFFDLAAGIDLELPAKLIVNADAVATIELSTVTFRRMSDNNAAQNASANTLGSMLDRLNMKPELEEGERVEQALVFATLVKDRPDGSMNYRTVALAPAKASSLDVGLLLDFAGDRARGTIASRHRL